MGRRKKTHRIQSKSSEHHSASLARWNLFPQKATGNIMEMGTWQPLWLTVNRILVRHTASGEAHGVWHQRNTCTELQHSLGLFFSSLPESFAPTCTNSICE